MFSMSTLRLSLRFFHHDPCKRGMHLIISACPALVADNSTLPYNTVLLILSSWRFPSIYKRPLSPSFKKTAIYTPAFFWPRSTASYKMYRTSIVVPRFPSLRKPLMAPIVGFTVANRSLPTKMENAARHGTTLIISSKSTSKTKPYDAPSPWSPLRTGSSLTTSLMVSLYLMSFFPPCFGTNILSTVRPLLTTSFLDEASSVFLSLLLFITSSNLACFSGHRNNTSPTRLSLAILKPVTHMV